MDWQRLESTVASLLTGLSQFDGQLVNTETLLITAYDGEPNWRGRPEATLYATRALDVLDILGLAVMDDGINRRLTRDGQIALDLMKAGVWHLDSDNRALNEWAELEELATAPLGDMTKGNNRFVRLRVGKWRQFESIDLRFHERLTIITGANGAGKTTLLNILAPHFSWHAQLVSSRLGPGNEAAGRAEPVGDLRYSNGVDTPILESRPGGVTVTAPSLPHQQQVPGIFISSHRSISSYQQLQNLPARFSEASVLLSQFASEVQTRYVGGMSQYPPLYRMKEALVSAALHGYGNVAVVANDEARAIWEGFQDVLLQFLPSSLGFQKLRVHNGDVLLETSAGPFPLEAVSGGLSAMLELAWQIFLRGRDSAAFTVCIDEPENHLHPELQRKIVPALLSAFPSVSFVIATHSPFVVTASSDSHVYALTKAKDGVVRSRLLRDINSSGTSDETLISVLGLETPLPLWAETRLSDAIASVPPNPSAAELRLLRERLVDAGLDDQFPAALVALRRDDEL